MRNHIRLQFEHHRWAEDILLGYIRELPEEALTARPLSGVSSMLTTLTHATRTETSFVHLLQHRDAKWSGLAAIPAAPQSLKEVEEELAEQRAGTSAYLGSLTLEAVDEVLTLPVPDGRRFEFSVGLILQHVLSHHAQHRAELASLISEAGADPFELDLLVFLNGERGFDMRQFMQDQPRGMPFAVPEIAN
jgi:uncharacterized damage-inducible protein DinB